MLRMQNLKSLVAEEKQNRECKNISIFIKKELLEVCCIEIYELPCPEVLCAVVVNISKCTLSNNDLHVYEVLKCSGVLINLCMFLIACIIVGTI